LEGLGWGGREGGEEGLIGWEEERLTEMLEGEEDCSCLDSLHE
jgi:hypothetical protein